MKTIAFLFFIMLCSFVHAQQPVNPKAADSVLQDKTYYKSKADTTRYHHHPSEKHQRDSIDMNKARKNRKAVRSQ